MHTSISDIIMKNSKRPIEKVNLFVDKSIISGHIGQCVVRIRKANNNNILPFKLSTSLLPKLLSTWIACGHSGFRNSKLKLGNIAKADVNIMSNYKKNRQKEHKKMHNRRDR